LGGSAIAGFSPSLQMRPARPAIRRNGSSGASSGGAVALLSEEEADSGYLAGLIDGDGYITWRDA
jgi:hypothetical protein